MIWRRRRQGSGAATGASGEAALVRDLPPGSYTAVVRPKNGTQAGVGIVEIFELSNATSENSRLTNLSTRCIVGVGDHAPIAGWIVGEPHPIANPVNDPSVPDRRVLMFGRGPSLTAKGVTGAVGDTLLHVYEMRNGNAHFIDSNDHWAAIDDDSGDGNGLQDQLVEAGFAGVGNESALWPTLRPGTYTAVLSGKNNSEGIGLFEIYEY
jgi:hypothetical protein